MCRLRTLYLAQSCNVLTMRCDTKFFRNSVRAITHVRAIHSTGASACCRKGAPDRELLSGKVEVDETYIGGIDPGLTGGRARGKKVLTCVAVEILEPKGFGRCRMAPVTNASAQSLLAFVSTNVEPGAT